LLNGHDDVKQRLLGELSAVDIENLDVEQLNNLKYLDAVLKETMRYNSPFWVLGREALGDDQLGEYKILKGDSIIFSPFMLHSMKIIG